MFTANNALNIFPELTKINLVEVENVVTVQRAECSVSDCKRTI